MTIFEIFAAILTIVGVGGYLNEKFIGLPATMGYMSFALLLSVLTIVAGEIGLIDVDSIKNLVSTIDFSALLLHGMLSFLLFAGALHIDLHALQKVSLSVGVLATFGVLLATFIIGTLVWAAALLIHVDLPYVYALLFGALISPTDPIAVLSMLKQGGVSKKLYSKIGGESLFNDGVGVVTFIAILNAIAGTTVFHPWTFFLTFLEEGIGGIALGIALGWLTYFLIRSINEYKVEIILTLALVTGGYALAEALHVSAPLCIVAAGLIIGNQGRSYAMSQTTREHVDIFWEIIDEVLNSVLFLLVGLVLLIVPVSPQTVLLGVLAAAAVLLGRFLSVGLPISLIRLFYPIERGTVRILTWGGLRGGLSLALALSLPENDEKSLILTMSYIVVLFSIFVQGLTFKKFISVVLSGDKNS